MFDSYHHSKSSQPLQQCLIPSKEGNGRKEIFRELNSTEKVFISNYLRDNLKISVKRETSQQAKTMESNVLSKARPLLVRMCQQTGDGNSVVFKHTVTQPWVPLSINPVLALQHRLTGLRDVKQLWGLDKCMVLIYWRIPSIFSLLIKKFFVIVFFKWCLHQMSGYLFSKRCKMQLICKEKQENWADVLRDSEMGTK